MKGLETWQSGVAQNLSAAQVPGYKKIEHAMSGSEPMFVSSVSGPGGLGMQRVVRPESQVAVNEMSGALVSTENPHDVAISGEGYFKMQSEDGQVIYSRNGSLGVDANGRLINSAGLAVMDGAREVVTQPELGKLVIREDGTVEQGGTRVAQLEIVRFENPDGLERVAGGFVASMAVDPQGVRMDDARVKQGFIEQSNLSPSKEMVDLITISRAYEANQKVITTIDERMGESIRSLNTTS